MKSEFLKGVSLMSLLLKDPFWGLVHPRRLEMVSPQHQSARGTLESFTCSGTLYKEFLRKSESTENSLIRGRTGCGFEVLLTFVVCSSLVHIYLSRSLLPSISTPTIQVQSHISSSSRKTALTSKPCTMPVPASQSFLTLKLE